MKKTKKKKNRPTVAGNSKLDGMKAIIGLQAMAGYPVSEAYASVGWDRMSESQRKHTLHVYGLLRGQERTPVGRLPITRKIA